MRNTSKISVLMSVYNTEFFLIKRAIDSVLNQTYQDFELIIIDDGSNNSTHNLLLEYAMRFEHKIIYIRHKNRGQSSSINRGILNCEGQFIAILDADDAYKPNHLETCLAEMVLSDLIASVTETVVDTLDDYYVVDKDDPAKLIHVDDCILFATLFGKKEVFSAMKFQDGYGSDADFYARAASQYRVKKVDSKTYIYYRNIPNSICFVAKEQRLKRILLN